MAKLTAMEVRNAKAGRHCDGKDLYLLVKPSGAKSWVLRIQVNGRRRNFGLGPTDLLSLEEARDKALKGRNLAKAGLDPSLEWKKAREVMPSFEEAARGFHGTVKSGWRNGKHGAQWRSTLKTYAFPIIGRRPVDQVDAAAIQSVLLPDLDRKARDGPPRETKDRRSIGLRSWPWLETGGSADARRLQGPAEAGQQGSPLTGNALRRCARLHGRDVFTSANRGPFGAAVCHPYRCAVGRGKRRQLEGN